MRNWVYSYRCKVNGVDTLTVGVSKLMMDGLVGAYTKHPASKWEVLFHVSRNVKEIRRPTGETVTMEQYGMDEAEADFWYVIKQSEQNGKASN